MTSMHGIPLDHEFPPSKFDAAIARLKEAIKSFMNANEENMSLRARIEAIRKQHASQPDAESLPSKEQPKRVHVERKPVKIPEAAKSESRSNQKSEDSSVLREGSSFREDAALRRVLETLASQTDTNQLLDEEELGLRVACRKLLALGCPSSVLSGLVPTD